MAAGTCASAVEAVGEPACREAIALIRAVRERFLADLEAAKNAAGKGEASVHHDK
jgi:hypothetical protein